uniref:Uncharacterized protein n=1 Tax=Aegilops tauschii subsp. strangulata TaxID=200361 RepID=A0A453IIH4_AEGTS
TGKRAWHNPTSTREKRWPIIDPFSFCFRFMFARTHFRLKFETLLGSRWTQSGRPSSFFCPSVSAAGPHGSQINIPSPYAPTRRHPPRSIHTIVHRASSPEHTRCHPSAPTRRSTPTTPTRYVVLQRRSRT